MPIGAVNTVRKHVSLVKGGRLAAAAAPARIVNLTVSDVAGDVLDTLTAPTVPDTTTAADARAVLEAYDLWQRVPEAIREHLLGSAAESPDLSEARISTTLLVTGRSACEAMTAAAATAGVSAVLLSTGLEGEARELGRLLANLAHTSAAEGTPVRAAADARRLRRRGLGHARRRRRVRHRGLTSRRAALAAALELDGAPVAVVMIDTDGSDGGTAAAGAVADGRTVARAGELGLDLRHALLAHRSGEPLTALGDLVMTGPTGTNVNDLFVIAIGDGRG